MVVTLVVLVLEQLLVVEAVCVGVQLFQSPGQYKLELAQAELVETELARAGQTLAVFRGSKSMEHKC